MRFSILLLLFINVIYAQKSKVVILQDCYGSHCVQIPETLEEDHYLNRLYSDYFLEVKFQNEDFPVEKSKEVLNKESFRSLLYAILIIDSNIIAQNTMSYFEEDKGLEYVYAAKSKSLENFLAQRLIKNGYYRKALLCCWYSLEEATFELFLNHYKVLEDQDLLGLFLTVVHNTDNVDLMFILNKLVEGSRLKSYYKSILGLPAIDVTKFYELWYE